MTTATARAIRTAIAALAREWEIPEAAIFTFTLGHGAWKRAHVEIGLPNDDGDILTITEDGASVIIRHRTSDGGTLDELAVANPRPPVLERLLGTFVAEALIDLDPATRTPAPPHSEQPPPHHDTTR